MDENESITIEVTRRTVVETGTTALLLSTLPRAALAADDAGPPPPAKIELQINGRLQRLRCAGPGFSDHPGQAAFGFADANLIRPATSCNEALAALPVAALVIALT
jgi:hypothetical protein